MRSYRYKVNKEKHTVVCILTVDKPSCKGTFAGIAKCEPQDTFDEEYGKLLAKRKAILKEQTEELFNIEWDWNYVGYEKIMKEAKYLIKRKTQLKENIKKLKSEIKETKETY